LQIRYDTSEINTEGIVSKLAAVSTKFVVAMAVMAAERLATIRNICDGDGDKIHHDERYETEVALEQRPTAACEGEESAAAAGCCGP
jgi:hypothetical protein